MTEMQDVQVKPMYGYGWDKGDKSIDVPPPFRLVLSPHCDFKSDGKSMHGQVQEADHPLDGYWVIMTSRNSKSSSPDRRFFADRDKSLVEQAVEDGIWGTFEIRGFAQV